MVRNSRFFECFLWFPEGLDPRSARAGAVKTQFPPFDLASKTVLFLRYLGAHSRYLWRRKHVQKTFQIELQSKICESLCFLCPGHVFGSLLNRFWTAFSRVWDDMAIKRARFSCTGSPGLAKSGISPCLGATGASRLSRFLASGALENDNLICLAPKAMPSKRRPFKFDGKLGSAT